MATIVSARYVDETRTTILVVLDNGREIYVPVDPANQHYQMLLAYMEENPDFVVEEPPAPLPDAAPRVPKVALVRAMRVTRMNGALVTDPAVQASVWAAAKASLPGAPPDLREDWEHMAEVPRDDPVILYVVDALPWTGQYGGAAIMDEIFRRAAEIAAGAPPTQTSS